MIKTPGPSTGEYLEAHSSHETNKRLGIIAIQIHQYRIEAAQSYDLDAVNNYFECVDSFIIECSMIWDSPYLQKAKILRKRYEQLYWGVKGGVFEQTVGITKTIIDTVKALDSIMRSAMQDQKQYFFRTGQQSIRGIDALDRFKASSEGLKFVTEKEEEEVEESES